MGTRRRHTPEQIIRKLREGEKLIGQGSDLAEVCKQLEISKATWHRWVAQYGGMKADDAKRLKDLEREKARLKKIVADRSCCVSWSDYALGRRPVWVRPPAPAR